MNEIAIARATPADIPGLVRCAVGLFAEDAGARDETIDAEWPLKHAAQRFTETISDPARLVPAARHADAIVVSLSGVVAAARAMRLIRVATLISIYVHPRYAKAALAHGWWKNFTPGREG